MDYDGRRAKNLPQHDKILNDAALLETTRCAGLDEQARLNFERLVGEAVALPISSSRHLKAAGVGPIVGESKAATGRLDQKQRAVGLCCVRRICWVGRSKRSGRPLWRIQSRLYWRGNSPVT